MKYATFAQTSILKNYGNKWYIQKIKYLVPKSAQAESLIKKSECDYGCHCTTGSYSVTMVYGMGRNGMIDPGPTHIYD